MINQINERLNQSNTRSKNPALNREQGLNDDEIGVNNSRHEPQNRTEDVHIPDKLPEPEYPQ